MADGKSQPLPKSAEPELDRTKESYAALGIGLVVLLIGVPIWWKTTEVYRCSLPYNEIDQLKTLPLSVVVRFDVIGCTGSVNQAKLLPLIGQQLTESLNNQADSRIERVKVPLTGCIHTSYVRLLDLIFGTETLMSYEIVTRECSTNELQDLSASVISLDDLGVKLSSSKSFQSRFSVYVVSSDLLSKLSPQQSASKAVVTRRRQAFVSINSDDVSITVDVVSHVIRDIVIGEKSVHQAFNAPLLRDNPQINADKDRMRSLKLSSRYDVTFSLINSMPQLFLPRWDIGASTHKYLGHFLTSLKDFVSFDIKSQFLHHIGLGVIPQRDEKLGHSVLSFDQLPRIINPIEAHLGSYISNNPHINFITYIPSQERMPLIVYDEFNKPSKTNALFSPRWGGVYFYNLDDATVTSVLTNHSTALPLDLVIDMRRVMSVFAAQLRTLIGFHTKTSSDIVTLQPAGSHIITEWELDGWLLERCVESVSVSTATLVSLSELLSKISNLVINDDISRQVESSVRLITESRRHLVNRELKQAFLTSQAALVASEKAFFDPSLLELLYFPEDQKFAIYIPLFLPVGLPIVLSAVHAFKWLKKRRTSETATSQTVKTKSE